MKCPICSNETFVETSILKKRLIDEWQLSDHEVAYINKQQGFHCDKCSSSLRSMTLADSIMDYYNYEGIFKQFPYSYFGRKLRILEINEAGSLHKILKSCKNYEFAEYPSIDIQNLPYNSCAFDAIIHSDTLEHVNSSNRGLLECYRVLKEGGVLFYTIPIIYGRLSKSREGFPDSFHGVQDETQGMDYKVFTEYGADFWVEILQAGFTSYSISTISDITSLAICCIKRKPKSYNSRMGLKISAVALKLLNKIFQ